MADRQTERYLNNAPSVMCNSINIHMHIHIHTTNTPGSGMSWPETGFFTHRTLTILINAITKRTPNHFPYVVLHCAYQASLHVAVGVVQPRVRGTRLQTSLKHPPRLRNISTLELHLPPATEEGPVIGTSAGAKLYHLGA